MRIGKKLLGVLTCTLLASCGQSGGPSGDGASPDSIIGTAAIGAPLANARVTVKGRANDQACERVTQADANGVYSVGLAGCDGPYLIRAETTTATVHSVAQAEDRGGRVNVTPLSEAVAIRSLGNSDLSNLSEIEVAHSNSIADNINTAADDVKGLVEPILERMNVAGADILRTAFNANGQGFDRALDAIDVRPSGSGASIRVKGTGTSLEVPSDISSPASGIVSSADLDTADTVTSNFDQFRTILNNLNSCLSNGNKTCFENYVHSSFMDEGYAFDDWWDDWWEFSSTEYIQYGLPVLIDIDGSTADLMVMTTYFSDGEEEDSWNAHVQMKLESGDWKFAGSGMLEPLFIEPVLVVDGDGRVFRGYSIEHEEIFDNYGSVPNFTITFDDLGISSSINKNEIDGYNHLNVQNTSLRPECYNDSVYCRSFIDLTDVRIPNFTKVIIDIDGGGVFTTYVAAPKAIPNNLNDFPSFTNIRDGGMCGTGFSSYQSGLSFSIPQGHFVSGTDAGPINSNTAGDDPLIDFSETDGNWWDSTRSSMVIPFDNYADTPLDVLSFNAKVTTTDEFGFSYHRIYGCVN